MTLFISFRFFDFVDIVLVAFLLHQLYRLVKGTVAINIFSGLAALYLLWLIVQALNMQMLSAILGQFIGVGVLAIIIVFQQEIRRFLLVIGARYIKKRFSIDALFGYKVNPLEQYEIEEIVNACESLSQTHTGGLIVICSHGELSQFIQTGTQLDAKITAELIKNIFFNKAPLHDGAMIIATDKIKAAGCILPTSDSDTLPSHYGLRHRAALGMSEETDSLVLIVSEETGYISYALKGQIRSIKNLDHLRGVIKTRLK